LLAMAAASALLCGPALAFDADLTGTEDELLGGSTEIAMAPDDPVVGRENVVQGFVEESFEDSLATPPNVQCDPTMPSDAIMSSHLTKEEQKAALGE